MKNMTAFFKIYNKLPQLVKRLLLLVPLLLAILVTVMYFKIFDKTPIIKNVQDPNIVFVNDDLRAIIQDGKVELIPFVEVLRASGRFYLVTPF